MEGTPSRRRDCLPRGIPGVERYRGPALVDWNTLEIDLAGTSSVHVSAVSQFGACTYPDGGEPGELHGMPNWEAKTDLLMASWTNSH